MRARSRVSAALVSLAALSLAATAGAAPSGLRTFVVDASAAPAASAEATARSAIAVAAPWAAGLTLAHGRDVRLTTGERVVHLDQVHLGVPVIHSGATVTLDASGAAKHVALKLTDDLPSSVAASIDATAAAGIATSFTRVPATHDDAKLAIFPTADGAKLVWVVYAAPTVGLPFAPLTIVDALTGDVVLAYDALVHMDAAKMYPTNPVKSPALIDVALAVGMGETSLQNKSIQSLNCIDKKHTKAIMGFMVHTCDLLQTAAPDANGDYLNAPGGDKDPEDTFSEISMFYHSNRAYEFFRGFDASLDVNSGLPLPTVSNLRLPQGLATLDLTKLGDVNLPLEPFQNAFFSPANPLFSAAFGINGGAMWFGQGPLKDYSYDGDVIYHEFTHSVVNVTLKLAGNPHMDEWGASYSPGAMNEGLADYFSSALAGDPDVGEYASQDFMQGSKAIRTLDNKDTCPADVGGEVHQDSTLFSGALWEARKALSVADQSVFDGAIFKAMNSSPTGDLAYEDFAKLAAEALTASSLGKAGADALNAAFTAHGVLPKCTRLLDYAGKPISGPKALQGLLWSPGTSTTGVSVKPGGYTAGVVQIHYKLPSGTGKLDVSFHTVDVGGGGFGMMGTPFKPNLITRFAADPIQFKYKPMAVNAGTTAIDVKASGKDYSASIDVPPGSTDVYVMVGNLGQLDGAYTTLSLDASPGTTTTTGTGGAGGATVGTTTSSAATGTGGSSATPKTDSGCGCSIPAPVEDTAPALGALAVIALAFARRRKAT